MITKIVYKKKKSLETILANHNEIYAVDSEVDDLKYLYDGKDFAIANDFMGFRCRFEEVPEMIKWIKISEIRKELMEIYSDLNERRDRITLNLT